MPSTSAAAAVFPLSNPFTLPSAHAAGTPEATDLVASLNALCKLLGFSIQIVNLRRDGPSTRHRSEPAANFHAVKKAVTITIDQSSGRNPLPTKIEMRIGSLEMPCEYLLMPDDDKYLLRAIATAKNAMFAWENAGLEATHRFRQTVASDQEIDEMTDMLTHAGKSAAAIYARHIAEGGTIEPEDEHFIKTLLHRYGPHRYLDREPGVALARSCLNVHDFSPPENEPDVYDLALNASVLGIFQKYLGWPLVITQQSSGFLAQAASGPSLPGATPNDSLIVHIHFSETGSTFWVKHLKTTDTPSTGHIMLAPDDDKPLCRAVATARLLLNNWYEHPQIAGDMETERLWRLLSAS